MAVCVENDGACSRSGSNIDADSVGESEDGMERSAFDRRSTVTLHDTSVLRGTVVSTLLRRFGEELRTSPDKIAIDWTLANKSFERSFSVGSLDIFLSHSWHASWLRKYICLLFHFNGYAAVFSSMACTLLGLCIVSWTVTLTSKKRGMTDLDMIMKDPQINVGLILVFVLAAANSTVFLIVLFFWRSIASELGCRMTTTFFDKVCIHQTDAEQKAKGIASIGGIIGKSKTLLVAWDQTYFTRLWCPFEIAAFRKAKPEGKVVVLPIETGHIVALLALAGLFKAIGCALLTTFCHDPLYLRGAFEGRLPFYCFLLIPYMLFAAVHQANQRVLFQLETLFSTYSVQNCESYCCKHNHIHPDTGQRLACDREIVFSSIAHWHGSGNLMEGLEKFNEYIRKMCLGTIKGKLGRCGVPYVFALMATAWRGMMEPISMHYREQSINRDGKELHFRVAYVIVYTVDLVFLRDPLVLALIFYLSRRFSLADNRGGLLRCVARIMPGLVGYAFDILVTEAFVLLANYSERCMNNVDGACESLSNQMTVPVLFIIVMVIEAIMVSGMYSSDSKLGIRKMSHGISKCAHVLQ